MKTPATPELAERLSRMATQWSLVLEAHQGSDVESRPARQELVEQYLGAVFRYLLGAVRDLGAAEDLAQEFATRLLSGDFHRVHPDRGRFRDYLKKVLVNLVNDHFRALSQRPQALPAGTPATEPKPELGELSLEDCLKEDLIDRTWRQLELERPRFHAVLLLRVQGPELTSQEIAARLERECDITLGAAAVRKNLERARSKFGQLLVAAVEGLIDSADEAELRAELSHLGLLSYCETALEKRATSRKR